MIKIIVILLILVNGGYFAWSISTGNIFYSAPDTYEEGVQKLVLIPNSKTNVSANKPNHCYTVGPFGTQRTASLLSKKVGDLGFRTEITTKETMQILNYFVYLQPLATRKDALAVISEISKHEVRQYDLIEAGTYKNAIGLGSFNDIDQARRHAEYIRFLGFDAQYTRQRTHKEVYWMSYNVPAGVTVPVLLWSKEIAPNSKLQKFPQACLDS